MCSNYIITATVAYIQIDDGSLSKVLHITGTAMAKGKEISDSQMVPPKAVLTQLQTGTTLNRPTQENILITAVFSGGIGVIFDQQLQI